VDDLFTWRLISLLNVVCKIYTKKFQQTSINFNGNYSSKLKEIFIFLLYLGDCFSRRIIGLGQANETK